MLCVVDVCKKIWANFNNKTNGIEHLEIRSFLLRHTKICNSIYLAAKISTADLKSCAQKTFALNGSFAAY